MAKSIPGNPDLDRDVVQRFVQVRDALAAAVADVLGNEGLIRNLGQDALVSVETGLLEIMLEAYRGRVVLPKWHTVRARQSLGGVIGSISKRVADLEEALTTPDPGPKAEVTELEVAAAADSDPEAEVTALKQSLLLSRSEGRVHRGGGYDLAGGSRARVGFSPALPAVRVPVRAEPWWHQSHEKGEYEVSQMNKHRIPRRGNSATVDSPDLAYGA